MPINIEQILDRIVIGTANFDSNYGLSKQKDSTDALLDCIWESKIKKLDLSNGYDFNIMHLNSSERKWSLQFKIQIDLKSPVESYRDKLEVILSQLNKSNLDRILIHNGDRLLEIWGLKVLEKIQRITPTEITFGLSLYDLKNLFEVLRYELVKIVQFPSNVFDRRLDNARGYPNNNLMLSNVILQARSIFLQGLLVNPNSSPPVKIEFCKNLLSDWYSWNAFNKLSVTESALTEVLIYQKFDEITLGIDSVSQLKEITSSVLRSPRFNLVETVPEVLIDPRQWHK
jgi:hypothetical protein